MRLRHGRCPAWFLPGGCSRCPGRESKKAATRNQRVFSSAAVLNSLFTVPIDGHLSPNSQFMTTAPSGRRAGPIPVRNQEGHTMSKFLKLIKDKKGATAIEYGLIAALIAVAAIGAMQGIGNKLSSTFNNVSNHLN